MAMPPAYTPIIPPSAAMKLRSACDSCAVAKVKCDKKQPICDRCRQNSFSCVYSPSRRAGKHSWLSRVAQQPTLSLMPVPAYTPDDSASGSLPESLNQSINEPTQEPSMPVSLDNFDLDWADFDMSMSMAPPVNTFAPSDVFPAESMSSPARFQPSIHDCEAKGLASLHSLHYCTMFHSESPGVLKADPLLERPSTSLLPLDKVLLFNRVAIAVVRGLLGCSCAKKPHVALLYMAIISKSLEWYRFAIAPQNDSSCPSVDTPMSSNGDSSASIATEMVPTRGVKNTAIQIGNFNLEEDDQRAVMRNVLTREVKKLHIVLDEMQAPNEHSMHDDQHEENHRSYLLGIPQMRAEVRETLKRIDEFNGAGWA